MKLHEKISNYMTWTLSFDNAIEIFVVLAWHISAMQHLHLSQCCMHLPVYFNHKETLGIVNQIIAGVQVFFKCNKLNMYVVYILYVL